MQNITITNKWNPNKTLGELSPYIRKSFIEEADFLFSELSGHWLEIKFKELPSTYGGRKKRSVVSRNPGWYRILYGEYSSPRKGRRRRKKVKREKYNRDSNGSYINRHRILESLERILEGKDEELNTRKISAIARYDSILRTLIFTRLTQGFISHDYEEDPKKGTYCPPKREVCKYFDIESIRYREETEGLPF